MTVTPCSANANFFGACSKLPSARVAVALQRGDGSQDDQLRLHVVRCRQHQRTRSRRTRRQRQDGLFHGSRNHNPRTQQLQRLRTTSMTMSVCSSCSAICTALRVRPAGNNSPAKPEVSVAGLAWGMRGLRSFSQSHSPSHARRAAMRLGRQATTTTAPRPGCAGASAPPRPAAAPPPTPCMHDHTWMLVCHGH